MAQRPYDFRLDVISRVPTHETEPHAWFDRMRALPTCVGALSLRNQAEIDAHTPAEPNELYRYIWPNDPHPERIDACKLTLPPLASDGTLLESQPNNKKIELLLDTRATPPRNIATGILAVSWEVMFTNDWKFAVTPQDGEDWRGYKFKAWQLTYTKDKIYDETRMLWGRARSPQYVAVADVRSYDLGDTQAQTDAIAAACGISGTVGYYPTGENALPNYGTDTGELGGFDVPIGKILRFTKQVKIGCDASEFESWNRWRPTLTTYRKAGGGIGTWPRWDGPLPAGRYNMLSEYVSGEDFDPICLLDRVPARYKPGLSIGKFYSEMNTSAHILRHGDAIMYQRNFVAWTPAVGLDEDPSPLSRPVR